MQTTTTQTRSINDWWWLGVIEGIIAILFGIAAIFWPGLGAATLVYIFSAYVIASGIIAVIFSLAGERGFTGLWWLRLIFGIFALGVGVYLVRHPGVTFLTMILLIGFTFIIRGLFEIVLGIVANTHTSNKVLAIIVGILGLVAGIIILRQPVAGGVAFVWVLGLYALLTGPLAIVYSLEHRHAPDLPDPVQPIRK